MCRASCKGAPASALNNATSRSTMWKGRAGMVRRSMRDANHTQLVLIYERTARHLSVGAARNNRLNPRQKCFKPPFAPTVIGAHHPRYIQQHRFWHCVQRIRDMYHLCKARRRGSPPFSKGLNAKALVLPSPIPLFVILFSVLIQLSPNF